MSNFSKDISNFLILGTFDYKFDDVGNIIINSGSATFQENYLAFPIQTFVYDESKLEHFYDSNFVEFIPQNTIESVITSSLDVSNDNKVDVDLLIKENESLKTELDSIIKDSENDSSKAMEMSIKQIILQLRIKLGEGKVDADFSTDFPYLPIAKDRKK